MFELILKITLAHLIGDFVLQTNKMVADIDSNAYKSKYLYLHAIIHLMLLIVITNFEKQYIIPAIILSFIHLLIDIVTKIVIKNKISSIKNLFLDQILHAITLSLFVDYFFKYEINVAILLNSKNYLLIIALITITYVAAILIKKLMELFDYPIPNDGLKDAGKYIGMLERLFIFVFIITSFWEGIGFLLAAKSIFRFGDLKEQKEIKLTEYILIGTLVSFGIAILIGKIYLKLENLL
jgi:Protein of unknown function (DUF3307)